MDVLRQLAQVLLAFDTYGEQMRRMLLLALTMVTVSTIWAAPAFAQTTAQTTAVPQARAIPGAGATPPAGSTAV
jgi:hypothetical protein